MSKNLEKLSKLDNSRFTARVMLATGKPVEFKIKELAASFPSIRVLFVKDFLKLTPSEIGLRTTK